MKDIICLRIRELRIKHNLTQEQVAKVLGVKKETYGKCERGQKKRISIIFLWKLADFYDVSIDYLAGRED